MVFVSKMTLDSIVTSPVMKCFINWAHIVEIIRD